jgi:hypothetical protein
MDTFNKLSMTTKVVLGATILFLIVSFFNWQEVDVGVAEAGRSMWSGWGTIAGIVALVLLAWEGLRIANVNVSLPISDAMLAALVAVLLALLTIIKFLADNEFRTFWAWLGLVLALVIAGAAIVRMQEGGEGWADVRKSMGSAATAARTRVDRDDTSATPPPPPPPAAPRSTETPPPPDTPDDTRT